MLRDSNHGVAEIIFESGFNNISWASEQFKKKYGMTMSQYRKKERKNDLPPPNVQQ
jgi:AraC-like DNA-binding protein